MGNRVLKQGWRRLKAAGMAPNPALLKRPLYKPQPKPELDAVTATLLPEHYRPDIARLEEVLERELSGLSTVLAVFCPGTGQRPMPRPESNGNLQCRGHRSVPMMLLLRTMQLLQGASLPAVGLWCRLFRHGLLMTLHNGIPIARRDTGLHKTAEQAGVAIFWISSEVLDIHEGLPLDLPYQSGN